MTDAGPSTDLEREIGLWRERLLGRQGVRAADVAELEDHLREQIDELASSGLDPDEAFLIAVKRIGALDALSAEFAREHPERLWKQLVDSDDGGADERGASRMDALVAFGCAVAAALLFKLPVLFGLDMDQNAGFYGRNLSLFVLPLLTGYFVWKRGLRPSSVRWLAAAFMGAIAAANVYPLESGGHLEVLTSLHLPIALWLLVGVAYAGGRWHETGGRMDFVRFSGEVFIYYTLIALGGGVLTAIVAMLFEAIGVDVGTFIDSWLLPCGALGAVVVASWLVEAKQSVIENMAPVLTRLFTPLFSAVLLVFLVTVAITGRPIDIQRDVLIAFDLLLAVVLGLLLYSISARDREAPPGPFDVLQVALVASALLADAVALWAIAARIAEFGFTPNRVAALGENLVLLVNLAWSAVLYARFLARRAPFSPLERWQTAYIPVYAAWATVVVVAFPPVFGFS